MPDEFGGVSVVALAVAVVAMGVSIVRTRQAPALLLSRKETLERRVAELEATVATLQRILLDKQNTIDQLIERLRILEQPAAQAPAPVPPVRLPVLVAVIGSDPALRVDLAALRDAESEGAFRLTRLVPATKAGLRRTLDRYRARGTPVAYLHFAVHSGPEGLALEDGMATPAWLSETLKSAQVALIAGCLGDEVGDMIGIVPAVVTLREEVSHEDAAQFARLFWSAVGRLGDAEAAFYDALRRAPQGISEFAELHI